MAEGVSVGALMCPVCGYPLRMNSKEAYCENNHRFDRAKQGYLNLLRSQSSGMGHHGDDRLMLTGRRSFLEKGYYHTMRQKMAELASEFLPTDFMACSSGDLRKQSPGIADDRNTVILDCGCGEGYYSEYLYSVLASSGKPVSMLCLDISKEAAKLTAKRNFPHETVVASAYELPVLSESCGMIVDNFAPVAEKEFLRVLAPGGILLRVVPEETHLWELKQAVYDAPYEKSPVDPRLGGFELLRCESVDYTIHLDCPQDIQSLFKMTPYYYKTSRSDQAKLEGLNELTTRLSFAVLVSRKL